MRFTRAARLAKAPYAHAAIVGGLVITAGACPIDGGKQIEGGSSVAGQVEAALGNLTEALRESGCSLQDVLKTTVFVVVPAEEEEAHRRLDETWEHVHRAFAGSEPASTLVGVARLGFRGQLVEIEAIAELPHLKQESQM